MSMGGIRHGDAIAKLPGSPRSQSPLSRIPEVSKSGRIRESAEKKKTLSDKKERGGPLLRYRRTEDRLDRSARGVGGNSQSLGNIFMINVLNIDGETIRSGGGGIKSLCREKILRSVVKTKVPPGGQRGEATGGNGGAYKRNKESQRSGTGESKGWESQSGGKGSGRQILTERINQYNRSQVRTTESGAVND